MNEYEITAEQFEAQARHRHRLEDELLTLKATVEKQSAAINLLLRLARREARAMGYSDLVQEIRGYMIDPNAVE